MPENRDKTGFRGPDPSVGLATQFKPGQSGNPGGRPKKTLLADACRELLNKPPPDDPSGRSYAELIAERLAAKAVAGDIRAAQALADRAAGKARQTVQIEHARLRQAFDTMSREELEAYAVSGSLPGWFPKNDSIQ